MPLPFACYLSNIFSISFLTAFFCASVNSSKSDRTFSCSCSVAINSRFIAGSYALSLIC